MAKVFSKLQKFRKISDYGILKKDEFLILDFLSSEAF
jgi:hypothetical protein